MRAIKGEVRKSWALSLGPKVETLNFPHGKRLERKITFANLGGLAIWFCDADDIFASDPSAANQEIGTLIAGRSVINLVSDLSSDSHMLVTTTSRVLDAA